ncbi:hypothetical protein Bca52824_011076 [Brassica carinata]|uniref:Uncharacterized protein n=1 Tax=Brassica carinata TaxID=52824 RepID=A0A8X7WHB0_BRACI|nr:hypothetical protein Bca52824_011076 [Brassica carinata]
MNILIASPPRKKTQELEEELKLLKNHSQPNIVKFCDLNDLKRVSSSHVLWENGKFTRPPLFCNAWSFWMDKRSGKKYWMLSARKLDHWSRLRERRA